MEVKVAQILEKVEKLYHSYGIKSVTMDDVAKHLGISKKTLYEYFKDKEDLVRQVLLKEQENINAIFEGILEKKLNAIEELFEVYKIIKEMCQGFNPSMEHDIRKYYPDIFTWIKDISRKRMFKATYDNLVKGKSEGLYRNDLNASVIARLNVSRTETLITNDVFSTGELASFKIFQEIFVFNLQGILSHKGRTFFEANFEKIRTGQK